MWKNPRTLFPGRQGKRMIRWQLPTYTSLEIMFKMVGAKVERRSLVSNWFDSYMKEQECHFNWHTAYWYILTHFKYWYLKLLKDKVSRCVRNTGNDCVLGWNRSEITVLGELAGNVTGK